MRTICLLIVLCLVGLMPLSTKANDKNMASPTGLAGKPANDLLVIADKGVCSAVVVVSPAAGKNEKLAAADLVKYIEMMSGSKPSLANTDDAIAQALASKSPLLIVGEQAIKLEPDLKNELDKVVKKNPLLRADAIILKRTGHRVYIAGNNDEAHYYAVAQLLREWGCRWFLPTEFGECIPDQPTLKIGQLDYTFGSPFEIRGYWISWNGDSAGAEEFQRRNMMNQVSVNSAHNLDAYTKELIPPGKTLFNIPIADDKTALTVANHPEIQKAFAAGRNFPLGMQDGLYESDSKLDNELRANLSDKYMLATNLTDNFLVLYNKVCAELLKQHPQSKSLIGFLGYANITIPPQREIIAAKPLVMSLAPIDIDPNHSMDDPLSPPKQEYREMMYRWAKVMEGRMFIYDYDQGMMVWRDIPNPCVQWIAVDIKHYAKAGILGINTECRNAIATVFLNLYVRGQLMWNPDADVNELLADFYPRFYGPAAEPMARYWSTLYKSWQDTIVTEHEYMVIPGIYTTELIAQLRKHLEAAESVMKNSEHTLGQSRDWKKYQERMKFTRLSFDLIDQYTATVRAAASECDYKKAVELGDKALATRIELGKLNNTFTTRVIPTMQVRESKTGGPAWMTGEIEQYRKIAQLTDGTKGTLLVKLPNEWAFHRDPNDTGVVSGYSYNPVDLTYWNKIKSSITLRDRKDYPTTRWEMLRTDLYAQAQGILHPDAQSYTGYMWYRTSIELKKEDVQGKVHIHFPGMFNEGWLYINGYLVAYRPFSKIWWLSDYTFEWDVDLAGKLHDGENTITVRLNNPHHFGGMFRRPFLYKEIQGDAK